MNNFIQNQSKIFDGKYIVVGIDGTGSDVWMKSDGSNSYVYRFCKTFIGNGNIALHTHLHGPDNMGLETESIGWSAYWLVFDTVHSLIRKSFLTKKSFSPHDEIRVILVGHSRGGAIAAWVANMLKKVNIDVYFLGLYDAVNWSSLTNTDVVKNAKYVYHALNGFTRSRISFIRTARSNTSGYYEEKKFITTHGGIGGDPFPSDSLSGYFPGSDFLANRAYLFEETEKNIELESKIANIWMLQKAESRGLRFRG